MKCGPAGQCDPPRWTDWCLGRRFRARRPSRASHFLDEVSDRRQQVLGAPEMDYTQDITQPHLGPCCACLCGWLPSTERGTAVQPRRHWTPLRQGHNCLDVCRKGLVVARVPGWGGGSTLSPCFQSRLSAFPLGGSLRRHRVLEVKGTAEVPREHWLRPGLGAKGSFSSGSQGGPSPSEHVSLGVSAGLSPGPRGSDMGHI